jgi:hypothetical protein
MKTVERRLDRLEDRLAPQGRKPFLIVLTAVHSALLKVHQGEVRPAKSVAFARALNADGGTSVGSRRWWPTTSRRSGSGSL